jgi:hypothetical protein
VGPHRRTCLHNLNRDVPACGILPQCSGQVNNPNREINKPICQLIPLHVPPNPVLRFDFEI